MVPHVAAPTWLMMAVICGQTPSSNDRAASFSNALKVSKKSSFPYGIIETTVRAAREYERPKGRDGGRKVAFGNSVGVPPADIRHKEY